MYTWKYFTRKNTKRRPFLRYNSLYTPVVYLYGNGYYAECHIAEPRMVPHH